MSRELKCIFLIFLFIIQESIKSNSNTVIVVQDYSGTGYGTLAQGYLSDSVLVQICKNGGYNSTTS